MPMLQRPIAVGLIPCQLVIVEERSRKVTLVNSFQRLKVDGFPSSPVPFAVYTELTDGMGEALLKLTVSRTDSLEDVYTRTFRMDFTDPLRQQRLWWNVRSCSFPIAGRYAIVLEVEGEPITQSILTVVPRGSGDG